jgi:hypothetical protein
MARQFQESIEQSAIDPKDIINELRPYLNIPVFPTLTDMPFSSITLPIENPGRWMKLHQEGQSTAGVGDTRVKESKSLTYEVSFIPSVDGLHQISIPFWAVGPYILIADDVPCYDRFTKLDAGVSVAVSLPGGFTKTWGTGVNIFHANEHDASIMDYILFVQTLSVLADKVVKDVPVKILITFIMYVDVSGEGSIGEFDFSFGKGEIYCPEVSISFPSV